MLVKIKRFLLIWMVILMVISIIGAMVTYSESGNTTYLKQLVLFAGISFVVGYLGESFFGGGESSVGDLLVILFSALSLLGAYYLLRTLVKGNYDPWGLMPMFTCLVLWLAYMQGFLRALNVK
jgi:hypothetical protein